MSPRAAWRLESLGFEQVYDYRPGKADWAAAGLPVEGRAASVPRVGDHARRDVPTCALEERVGEVTTRVRQAGWDTCLVVNDRRVVLGRLMKGDLEDSSDRRAGEAMRGGPSTFRPNVSIPEMAAFMAQHDLETAPVTTSDGVLVGMLLRGEAERVLEALDAGQ